MILDATPRAAIVFGLSLLAASAAVAVPEGEVPDRVHVRFAVVHGTTEAGRSLPADLSPLQQEIQGALEDWDLRADFEELRAVFGLAELSEITRWASTLPTPDGEIHTRLGDRWRLELESSVTPPDRIELRLKLFDSEELVSAPRLISRFGERMILSTASPETGDFVFFFFDVEPGGADD